MKNWGRSLRTHSRVQPWEAGSARKFGWLVSLHFSYACSFERLRLVMAVYKGSWNLYKFQNQVWIIPDGCVPLELLLYCLWSHCHDDCPYVEDNWKWEKKQIWNTVLTNWNKLISRSWEVIIFIIFFFFLPLFWVWVRDTEYRAYSLYNLVFVSNI